MNKRSIYGIIAISSYIVSLIILLYLIVLFFIEHPLLASCLLTLAIAILATIAYYVTEEIPKVIEYEGESYTFYEECTKVNDSIERYEVGYRSNDPDYKFVLVYEISTSRSKAINLLKNRLKSKIKES